MCACIRPSGQNMHTYIHARHSLSLSLPLSPLPYTYTDLHTRLPPALTPFMTLHKRCGCIQQFSRPIPKVFTRLPAPTRAALWWKIQLQTLSRPWITERNPSVTTAGLRSSSNFWLLAWELLLRNSCDPRTFREELPFLIKSKYMKKLVVLKRPVTSHWCPGQITTPHLATSYKNRNP